MTRRVIKLPDIGEGVTEAEIVAWHVGVGDAVAEDQLIGTVMTDKAAVEIPSPGAGTVVALGGQIGDVLAVGAELVRIESGAPPSSGTAGSPSDEVGAVRPAPVVDPPSAVDEPRHKARAAPAVRRRARTRGVPLHTVPGSGPQGRVTHEDLDRYLAGHVRHADGDAPVPGQQGRVDEVEDIPMVGMRRRIARHVQLASHRIAHFSYIEEIDVMLLEALRQGAGSAGGSRLPGPLPFIVMAMRDGCTRCSPN